MISCPLFGDQPGLAARCQDLGLAVPLALSAGDLPTVADVHRALERVQSEDGAMRSALRRARQWEDAVIDRRPEVLLRIVDLMV